MPSYYWNTKHKAFIKVCSCCKTEVIGTKDEEESYKIFLTNFAPNNGSSDAADKLQSRCWVCNQARRRDLGLTLEYLRDMLQTQEGVCSICNTPISLDRGALNPANVDHDAETGRVRQLLCGNCNRGLGLFFHNPEYLRMAAEYIEFHSKENEKESCDG